MTQLNIVELPVADLKPRANNPRTHSCRQIEQIAKSIKHFGFSNPVLIDNDNGIIAGHGRLKAAQKLGLETVPTVKLAHMSEPEIRAYVIADNRLAENAGWDHELLAIEFEYLEELEFDFDLSLTGFELPEIELIVDGSTPESDEDQDAFDEVVVPRPESVVSRREDVWIIGPHKLICGDATRPETYTTLLGNEQARMVFSDPPYNVPIAGNVGGLGAIKHREFEMASGEMTETEFTKFLTDTFQLIARHSHYGSLHFHCMDWRHMREIQAAGEKAYCELKNFCVWVKNNGGMGSLYRSKHEFVFVYKSGTSKHINNVELGRFGRYRTNVWEYAGVDSFGENRKDLSLHPTVKPVQLIADAIMDASNRKDIVLDAFAGSGSTLVAAEQTRRRGYAIELDPVYVDVTVRRMQTLFGYIAKHADQDLIFEEMELKRRKVDAVLSAETKSVDAEEATEREKDHV